jgi:hypothetical protein
MKCDHNHWKLPAALGMCFCSIASVALLYFIYYCDQESVRTVKHIIPPPDIAYEYKVYHQFGLILPLITTVVAIWFLTGKSVTAARSAWAALGLLVLHFLWLSWGLVALYLANQTFVM